MSNIQRVEILKAAEHLFCYLPYLIFCQRALAIFDPLIHEIKKTVLLLNSFRHDIVIIVVMQQFVGMQHIIVLHTLQQSHSAQDLLLQIGIYFQIVFCYYFD